MAVWTKQQVAAFGNYGCKIYSTCEITSQSRSGGTQNFTVKITMWVGTTGSAIGAYFNDKWTCSVSVGGKSFSSSLQIKGTTSGDILNKTYSASVSGSVSVSGSTGSVTVSVTHKNGTTGSTFATLSGSASISPLPRITLAKSSVTDTTATLTYSSSTISPSKVAVYQDNVKIKEVTSSPFTMTGLSPLTTYSFKGYGYGNGDWGDSLNTLSVTTNRQTVAITGISVSNITINSMTVAASYNNASNVQDVTYKVYTSGGSLVWQTTVTSTAAVSVTGLTPETSYYVTASATTKDTGVVSNTYTSSTYTTPSDKIRAYIKVNGAWVRGTMWIKVNGSWVEAHDAYIKNNGSWTKGVN